MYAYTFWAINYYVWTLIPVLNANAESPRNTIGLNGKLFLFYKVEIQNIIG